MENKFILFESNEGVAQITLNRPDVLNSFHREMAKEVQDAFREIENNPATRAVLLTGAGRAFCAGQDLAEVPPDENAAKAVGQIVAESYNPIIRQICHLEKPVVCAVNGVAAGAGANIALACDIVLASTQASFIQSFCNIGLIPDSGGTFFLPRLVGLPLAKAMMMPGDKIPAERALAMGLIYKTFEPDSLLQEAMSLAKHLATQPTMGIGLMKRAVNLSYTNDLNSQLDLERELQEIAAGSHDFLEGVKAFLEKRKPNFIGN